MSMELLANHIIAVAQEQNKEITNLQLQKIMYFALKYAIENDVFSEEELQELYDEPFLVWAYGPVVKSQYERFKRFGSAPILGTYHISDNLAGLNSQINARLKESASKLVKESHKVSFWKEHENDIDGFRSDIEYSLGDI
ncbi:Panacea domain-containing protein [Streptococcus parauberis]|uniref:Panacea domain-containing protein n=1 Tax=Streptococcus parauberis TaxID=1348 RepID=UPI0002BA4E5D|nr:type II toxin-antitoxin system antitoxin SocA domain-containing protein [Streptococcus parauberis]QBX09915.1 hypothetical protein JavanS397_0017 [Streptococcus satellite phage Javan397]EMF48566.1 hypothetical protein SPJ2_1779 [Streptococcus parauberis KRS-02109]UWM86760.1 DUF4065 domain-containing protein [Streptococcus parauberis]UWM88732.1 DUF4065 domain-containing protein [Streptococcus parauberis]WEM59513.1 DUF4065 domain-containing protein [Streptococcus parauberis]